MMADTLSVRWLYASIDYKVERTRVSPAAVPPFWPTTAIPIEQTDLIPSRVNM